MRELERFVILQVVDQRWREHLENMDYLREGVHLRAMAQKDPLVEYRAEGHTMFEELERRDPRGGRADALPRRDRARGGRPSSQQAQAAQALDGGYCVRARVARGRRGDRGRARAARSATAVGDRGGSAGGGSVATSSASRGPREELGRNDPCWCGSGKKFKKCHGA